MKPRNCLEFLRYYYLESPQRGYRPQRLFSRSSKDLRLSLGMASTRLDWLIFTPSSTLERRNLLAQMGLPKRVQNLCCHKKGKRYYRGRGIEQSAGPYSTSVRDGLCVPVAAEESGQCSQLSFSWIAQSFRLHGRMQTKARWRETFCDVQTPQWI